MKYTLLSVSKSPALNGNGINIGDYIQALAASQYYPAIDGFIDRDEDLKDYDGEECKMIMNGWYMHNPANWPPSNRIKPLFVAFHVNTLAKDGMLSPDGISYLKKHAPIGCRDLGTVETLKKAGIDAYFSACMTLTLGKNFHSEEKDNTTYIVDPILKAKLNVCNILKAIATIIAKPTDIRKLFKNQGLCLYRGNSKLKKLLKTALYHRAYARFFGRDMIMGATYICQEHPSYIQRFQTEMERLKEAERLVKLYAKARMVITSRIHCALPCLGLETPVIFLEKTNDNEASTCRLDGLRDLFNIVKVDAKGLTPAFNTTPPFYPPPTSTH